MKLPKYTGVRRAWLLILKNYGHKSHEEGSHLVESNGILHGATLGLLILVPCLWIFINSLSSSIAPIGFPRRFIDLKSGSDVEYNSPAAVAILHSFPLPVGAQHDYLDPAVFLPLDFSIPVRRNPVLRASSSHGDGNLSAVGNVPVSPPAYSGILETVILGFDHNKRASRLKTMDVLEHLLRKSSVRMLAFEFPSDLQGAFNEYCASSQGVMEQQRFALEMIRRYPPSLVLSPQDKIDCAVKILATESIKSLLDVARLARKYKAGVCLIDTPMETVDLKNLRIPFRNQVMAKNMMHYSGGRPVIVLVGSAHTGHGDLGLSFDDQLTQLGAKTISLNVASPSVPARRDWGTNRLGADYQISDFHELPRMITAKLPHL